MRTLLRSLALTVLLAAPALTQEEAPKADLLSPSYGLMAWTLIIFVVLAIILSKFAFGPITAAVRAREAALEEAITAAKRDREEAARLLEQHRVALDASRGEAQKLIADAPDTDTGADDGETATETCADGHQTARARDARVSGRLEHGKDRHGAYLQSCIR